MSGRRRKQLRAVHQLVQGHEVHEGIHLRTGGYIPSQWRWLKKAFRRARRDGAPVRLAMTMAALEVGRG